MIGALRDNGRFIPWDDDLDFLISRPDFNELLRLFESGEVRSKFRLLSWDNTASYRFPFAKLEDPQTTIVEFNRSHFGEIFVDIFPLDGGGNDAKRHFRTLKKMNKKNWLLYFNA